MIAGVSTWHEAHLIAREALDGVKRLPAHTLAEAYSVLTRLPAGRGVAPDTAAATLARFGGPALTLGATERGSLPARLAGAGVYGGATYDALIGLEAAAHGATLLTLDRRASETYARLSIDHRLLGT